jgi:hypothetical protein
MAQLAVVTASLSALPFVPAIAWRRRSSLRAKGWSRYPGLRSVGGLFRGRGEKSLPVEGFEDWKLHYLRIAISAPPFKR